MNANTNDSALLEAPALEAPAFMNELADAEIGSDGDTANTGITMSHNGMLLGNEAPKPTMLDKAILLTVEMRGFGLTRKVSSETVEADTDKDLVRVSKLLLDAPELQRLGQYDTQIRAYVAAKCLPSTIRKAVYFLPLVSLVEVDGRLREFAAGRDRLVDEFVAVYPQRIEQAELRLRDFFDPRDYPSPGQVKSLFSFGWQYISFGVPDALAAISGDLFDREKVKAQEQWREAQEAIQDLLRARLAAMIAHLQERLTPNEDGKMKVFKNTAVGNITTFLTDFEALNVTDDLKLAGVVEQARALLSGVDAETLRKSKNVREAIRQGFNEVQGTLDALIVDKPHRGIRFEDG